MRKGRRCAVCLAFTTLVLFAVSCSYSTEATTRQDQEKIFKELFGFNPPKTITEIKYRDFYTRYLMGDGWGRWMRFTYDKDVFDKIVGEKGYQKRKERYHIALVLASGAAPQWWPTVDETKVTIYLGDDDTDASEGGSIEDYLWHDTNSNFVYFHKRYSN